MHAMQIHTSKQPWSSIKKTKRKKFPHKLIPLLHTAGSPFSQCVLVLGNPYKNNNIHNIKLPIIMLLHAMHWMAIVYQAPHKQYESKVLPLLLLPPFGDEKTETHINKITCPGPSERRSQDLNTVCRYLKQ